MELRKAVDVKKSDELYKLSDAIQAQINTYKYLGKDIILYKSTNPNKKYMVYDDYHDKWKHFGSMKPPYSDYLKVGEEWWTLAQSQNPHHIWSQINNIFPPKTIDYI